MQVTAFEIYIPLLKGMESENDGYAIHACSMLV